MQRKPFRIEQTALNCGFVAVSAYAPALPQDLREAMGRHARDLAAVVGDGKNRRMTRAAGELGAAVESMEKATVTILQAAETIDDCAKALAAAQKTAHKDSPAQDIRERLVQIYEACDFQDLAGQRIGKVIAMLGSMEDQMTRIIARCRGTSEAGEVPAIEGAWARVPANGPRLDGDSGHANQHDIDAMFNEAGR